MKLTPEEHFQTVYKSRIVDLGETVNTYDPPIIVGYTPNPFPNKIDMKVEKVINIKMPESEYHRFMQGYENYIDLIYGMQDPIVRDMFDKMMVYIKLMK
jgi:hypothetical protein